MLEHGGRLRLAARRYGIPLADWLDLSTGLNPRAWPVPAIPARAWSRLPEEDDDLARLAQEYYGAADCLPVAGSQAAIQALPLLHAAGGRRIGMLAPAYAEHAHAWRRAGFEVLPLAAEAIEAAIEGLDHLLLVNPNNPTGQRFDAAQLLGWHRRLAARGGSLIVDEAFMDVTPADSLAVHSHLPGLIVLRSLGKFFGLAGARVGFVLAEPGLLRRLADWLG
ncbi:MAG TPA: aminotransferase class I/II-fold pyridoxal phosphate-dependent enzyme, partial [Aliiroseovarius sp.]|nr:aminotransferase class I/II-fold pyridoxal phosphate-dependent enzyme [Aliiroseovarius sp.]